MAFTAPTEQIVEEGVDLRSCVANEDVIRGQIVVINAAGDPPEVAPSASDGELCYGMATQTVSSGQPVTVATAGTEVRLTAGTADISAGDPLTSHGATGEEGQVDTADGAGDSVVAQAYEASGAQGDLVMALLQNGGEVNA